MSIKGFVNHLSHDCHIDIDRKKIYKSFSTAYCTPRDSQDSDDLFSIACEQALLFGRASRERSHETRFARPNRRACSQAIFSRTNCTTMAASDWCITKVAHDWWVSIQSMVGIIRGGNCSLSDLLW